ncbi:MAG: hypothetical protein MJY91_09790 [Bacteroidales bacterium]|nr:hypothetical protein [Bacteroidales bacterium]
MKRTLAILFSTVIFTVSAQAQVLGELGGAALKAAGALAGKVILNKVTDKIEEKVNNMSENTLVKVLGQQVDSTGNVTGMEGLTNAFSGLEALVEKSKTAGMAPLRDFSEQNAARKERNLTLVYDDWDL